MPKSSNDKNRPGWKACTARCQKRYREKHRGKYSGQKLLQKRRRALRIFGLTLEDYDLMLDAQNGICAICGEHPTARRLAVDHDHQTNTVRGLLCRACNVGLGLFREDTDRLLSAIDYLKRWGK